MPKVPVVRCLCGLALIGALSGCNEGSQFRAGTAPQEGPGFADRWAAERALAARVGMLETTPEANMPVAGSATYGGVAAVQYEAGFPEAPPFRDALIGEMELRADFAAASVAGEVTGWESQHAGPVAGRLDVDAQIDGNRLEGIADGTLVTDGWTADMFLDLGGAFVGDAADAVAGRLEGGVFFWNGAQGFAEGEFAAER